MQEWSPVQISSSTPNLRAHHALAGLSFTASSARTRRWRASWHSPSAMMTLRPALGGAHRLLQGLHHRGDVVGAHLAQPFDAERAQRRLDIHAGRRALPARRARRHVLLAGRRRVAVLHHDQHAVVLVEQVRGDAGDQPVVPEAAVAHHRDRARSQVRRDRGRARERHAVAEDRVAHAERREGRERMAADVGRDVGRADLALRELDARRTPGAPGSRCRNSAGAAGARRRPRSPRALWPSSVSALRDDLRRVDAGGLRGARKFASPRSITSAVYSPAFGSAPLPCMRVWMSARRSSALTACSM